MVGMVMRDDQPLDGFSGQRACQKLLPDRLGFAAAKAGINQRPAIAIVQGIDVDMIQRHRQRQAHPQDALGDFNRLALCGRGVPRMVDRVAHAKSASGVRA